MMPHQDGVETFRQIREIPAMSDVFVIFLTARIEEYSEIAAFDVAADDYITKPIKPRALMSRINAVFRRGKRTVNDDNIQIGELVIDKASYTVQINGKEAILPKKEFELIYYLAHSTKKVYSREELMQN